MIMSEHGILRERFIQLKIEISKLKEELNKINDEKERWFKEKERINKELNSCWEKHKSEFPRWLFDKRQEEQMKEACKDLYEKRDWIYSQIRGVKGKAAFSFLEKYFKVDLGNSTVYDVILLFCKRFKVMLVDDFGNILFKP